MSDTTTAMLARRAASSRWIVPSLIAVELLVLVVQRPRFGGDDLRRLEAARQLAEGQWPSTKYSMVLPLLGAPVYRIGEALGGFGPALLRRFDVGLWLVWICVMWRQLIRVRPQATVLRFVALSFCSMLPAYLLAFNADAASAMGLSAGMLVLLGDERRASRVLGALAVVLSLANVPAGILPFGLVALLLAARRRQPWWLAAPLAAAVLTVADATYLNGSLSISKYGDIEHAISPLLPWGDVAGFDHPIVFGIVGILFSLGRGLVFYLPAAVLAVRRPTDRVREWGLCLVVFGLAMVPLYAAWWAWYGGVTFGPRFFLVLAIPGAMALADVFEDRSTSPVRVVVASLLALWSAWVAVAGTVFSITPKVFSMCVTEKFRYEPLCWYSAEYSTLFAPLWDRTTVSAGQLLFAGVVGAIVVGAVAGPVRRAAGPVMSAARAALMDGSPRSPT